MVRNTDFAEFEHGDKITVAFRSEGGFDEITGEIECLYNEDKALISTESGEVIANLSDLSTEGGVRDRDTEEVLGRPTYVEA